jgi:uncharacterized membrane protein YkvA (DUF1232 family)
VSDTPEIYDSVDAIDEHAFLKTVRRLAARLPFVRHAVAMWHAMLDPQTPLTAKAVIVGALAYFLLPTDALPDFLGLVGFTDDAAVIAAAARAVRASLLPKHYTLADTTLRGPGVPR